MGFDKRMVVEALKQTDNNQDNALTLLTQSPELLMVKEESRRKNSKTNNTNTYPEQVCCVQQRQQIYMYRYHTWKVWASLRRRVLVLCG